jgi:Domain of unknown function (DUF4411)
MAYLLDADTFITAKNLYYGLDFCPGYWEWLIRENKARNVFSVEHVFRELCGHKDDLAEWAKTEGSGLFLPLDVQTSYKIAIVANYVQAMPPPIKEFEKRRFLDGADLILISCALAHGHTIVTRETEIAPDPLLTKVKIPNVCRRFGVTCATPTQMFRQLGASFGLLPKREYSLPEEPLDLDHDTESDEDYEE